MRDRLILIAVTFVLIGSVPATAQTPDGLTPAVEEVCDTLIGATPGLYGLCVAYCEAHDADLLPELDVPNRRILENYNKSKTESDPPMPCMQQEVGECPCWTAEELSTVFPPKTNFDANWLHACHNFGDSAILENVDNGLTDDRKFVPPAIQLVTGITTEATYCQVVETEYDGGPSGVFKVIDADEFRSCKALLAARANAAKKDGVVWDCF